MEIVDIGLSDLEPISMNFNDGPKPSVNFGTGIELLMNDKKKSSSAAMSMNLGELDKLENELNELWNGTEENMTVIDPKNNNWVEELNSQLYKLGSITSLLKSSLDTLDYPEMVAYLVKNQKIMQKKIEELEKLVYLTYSSTRKGGSRKLHQKIKTLKNKSRK